MTDEPDPALSAENQGVTGRLLRRDGAFILQCDTGGELELRLARVPVDHVGKSVHIVGRLLAPGLMEVEGVRGT